MRGRADAASSLPFHGSACTAPYTLLGISAAARRPGSNYSPWNVSEHSERHGLSKDVPGGVRCVFAYCGTIFRWRKEYQLGRENRALSKV